MTSTAHHDRRARFIQRRAGAEEAAFADSPRDVQWTRCPSPDILAENGKLLWGIYRKGFCYLTEQGCPFVNRSWPGADYHAMLAEPDDNDFVLAENGCREAP